jgi:cobalt transporter subunit CbtB
MSFTQAVDDSATSQRRSRSSAAPRRVAAAIGVALLYLAGFAQTQALHDGAHDTRHSSGFPCH